MDLAYYQSAALRNLRLMSRTVQGNLDVTSSADKAEKMEQGLTNDTAATVAEDNFQYVIEFAFQHRRKNFESPESLKNFFLDLAVRVNSGLLKVDHLIRAGADSSKYTYTRVADLPGKIDEFFLALYPFVNGSLSEDPRIVAAFIEWNVDFRGHFYGDGCGKCAKASSTWYLMRCDHPLPDYTMGGQIPPELARDHYYAQNAHDYIREDNPLRDAISFHRFFRYYQKLFII